MGGWESSVLIDGRVRDGVVALGDVTRPDFVGDAGRDPNVL